MSTTQDSREATMVGRRSDGTLIRRPLSPHLQVYDMMQMTSALSISHRITGVVWTAGAVAMVWWLVAAASGADAFGTVQWVFGSFLGILFLMGIALVDDGEAVLTLRCGATLRVSRSHRRRRKCQ
jgi:succinate dehydrogenase / fumarate reductase cytochrome b subunit